MEIPKVASFYIRCKLYKFLQKTHEYKWDIHEIDKKHANYSNKFIQYMEPINMYMAKLERAWEESDWNGCIATMLDKYIQKYPEYKFIRNEIAFIKQNDEFIEEYKKLNDIL